MKYTPPPPQALASWNAAIKELSADRVFAFLKLLTQKHRQQRAEVLPLVRRDSFALAVALRARLCFGPRVAAVVVIAIRWKDPRGMYADGAKSCSLLVSDGQVLSVATTIQSRQTFRDYWGKYGADQYDLDTDYRVRGLNTECCLAYAFAEPTTEIAEDVRESLDWWWRSPRIHRAFRDPPSKLYRPRE